jgi:hypothetical protein
VQLVGLGHLLPSVCAAGGHLIENLGVVSVVAAPAIVSKLLAVLPLAALLS